MENDFNYKMRHMGDTLISNFKNLGGMFKNSGRGISLTYSIDVDKKEKDKLISRIGRRLVAIRKNNPDQNIFEDHIMVKLLYRLDVIQDRIDSSISERKERLC